MASLAVYIRTLAPTIYALDSSGLTRAAYVLEPAHPPGYPLYLLLGRLFIFAVPWGDPGYRMNLMSAVFGAVAVAAVCRVLIKLEHRPVIAAGAALWLAFSFYFWSVAVMAEVYTLHCVLVAFIVLLLLQWREDGRVRWMGLLALIYGLSFGNHITVVLLAPGIAFFVWRTDRRLLFDGRTSIKLFALFASGLCVYLFVPLRSGFSSRGELLGFLTARSFWHAVFAYGPTDYARQLLAYAYDLWGSFLGIGLIVGGLGAVALWRRDNTAAGSLTLFFAVNVLFFAGYFVGDKQLMVAHTYLLWAIWLGAGAQQLAEWADEATSGRTLWTHAVPALLIGGVGLVCIVNVRHVDLSDDWRVREDAERILSTVEPQAVVLVQTWTKLMPLQYLQDVEAQRLDVNLVDIQDGGATAIEAALRAGSHAQRPVYAVERMSALSGSYRQEWSSACRCYRVTRRWDP